MSRTPLATRILTVVLLLTLAGCALLDPEEPKAVPSPTLSPSPLPTQRSEPPSPDRVGLQRFYGQDLSWSSCRGDLECATVRVPLDYDEPEGQTIGLSLLRVPAESTGRRVGSLVVNPGGPGVSGVDYAASASTFFGPELRQAFDIVGFDPRGVGRSAPVDCVSDRRLDAFVAADPDPDTPAEVEEIDQTLRQFGNGCVDRSGDLAGHISTVEAARDLDIIRAALGEGQLSWFGASYGTFLGATYAELYPDNVGRMVLDGAIDPTLSNRETALVQAKGFETALRSYVGACVEGGDCFLGGSVDSGVRRIRTFLDEVERSPLEGSGSRRLHVGNAVLGIWAPLYEANYWPVLDNALQAAFAGDGDPLLALSDAYTSRGPNGYYANTLEALYAVNCLDHPEAVPASEVAEEIPAFEQASPTFGAVFAYSLSSCVHWPVVSDANPPTIDAAGAAPILVVGTSRDPATPLAWAEALADQLDSAVLVRRDGDGHTGYRAGNPCVDDAVEAYLVSGTVPARDLDC
jgi:pimeloyl-ACP methyl ester carboxylesterase